MRAAEQDRPDVAAAGCGGRAHSTGSIRGAWCSSTRPGPKPTWRRCGVECSGGRRLVAKVPHGHWKTLTFVAALRYDRIDAPASSTARSTAKASAPMSSRSCCRRWRLATSSSWTTSAHIKDAPYVKRWPPVRTACSSCRPTRPTSTRSSRHSPSSKLCCERPRAISRQPLEQNCHSAQHLSARRMRQLLPQFRVCFALSGKCSSGWRREIRLRPVVSCTPASPVLSWGSRGEAWCHFVGSDAHDAGLYRLRSMISTTRRSAGRRLANAEQNCTA